MAGRTTGHDRRIAAARKRMNHDPFPGTKKAVKKVPAKKAVPAKKKASAKKSKTNAKAAK